MNYATKASLESIEQNLTETIADFLDSESVQIDEAIGLLEDPENRENSELHIEMAKAAMRVYIETMIHSK